MRLKLNICALIVVLHSTLQAQVSSIVHDYFKNDEYSVTEDGILPHYTPATADFVRETTKQWREILADIQSVAPDTRTQSLLVVACEFLPPDDYIKFLDQLIDIRKEKKIKSEALLSVMWANYAKSGFLAYNYDKPEVASVVTKLRQSLNADYPNEWTLYFDELLSGEMKTRLISKRIKDGEQMPEDFYQFDRSPYLRLHGGSLQNDVVNLVKHPVESVHSLRSSNRNNASMIQAIIFWAIIICLFYYCIVKLWKCVIKH